MNKKLFLRIALQAKGRLNEDSLRILREAGISLEESKRKLISRSNSFPLEVLYLRDDDIPQAVANGIADAGIVGQNEIRERKAAVAERFLTGFGNCRLSLAIPKTEAYTGTEWFEGKRIATSYPYILQRFFDEKKIGCRIERIAGSVEIAPSISLADGIFDIVSSGSTLISNGLQEVEKVMDSQAVLISAPGLLPEKEELLGKLIFRLESVKRSRGKKYILVNVPNDKMNEALRILPGMKSPTLLPLADSRWSAVHAVIDENCIWEVTERLKNIGAEDILVLALENMIP